jgi:dephospho-CoA kinase
LDSAHPHHIENQQRQVIGILGGIGSGKSSVAHGVRTAHVIDADGIGHDLLKQNNIRNQIVQAFGREILNEQGAVDRDQLANKVFGGGAGSSENRLTLEGILHPAIRTEVRRQINACEPKADPILLDAALLIEAGWDTECNAIVFVDTPIELRRKRVHRSRGWSADELQRREATQMPLVEKQNRADLVIDNSGSVQAASRQLDDWLKTRTKTSSKNATENVPESTSATD